MIPILNTGIWVNDHYQVLKSLGGGGFGQTYEVYDRRDGTVKVLKLLKREQARDKKALAYFQQEARILAQIKHPGIPSVDPARDGYFTWQPLEPSEALHCLVMEKIDGTDLKKEIERRNDQPLSQEQALHWLAQVTKILQIIHQQNFFHRDIKPENIMLRLDRNELVLIDFGVVRSLSETYAEKREDGRDITNIGTPSYKAPEVKRGEACQRSDFFSLGRTFVFLVTAQPIHNLLDSNDALIWRSHAPYISESFKDLLDRLMAPDPDDRPDNAQALLEEIETLRSNSLLTDYTSSDSSTLHVSDQVISDPISKEGNQVILEIPKERLLKPLWHRTTVALVAGIVSSTVLVTGVRLTGVLQPLELYAFDQMMRLRSTNSIRDEHILIVENTNVDVDRYKYQPKSGGAFSSISDESLLELLNRLHQFNAAVIGFDIRWDFPTRNVLLKEAFKENRQRLYGVCKISDRQQKNGFAKSQDISAAGFADTLGDSDGDRVVRRQLLVRDTPPTGCQENYSFASRVAFEYLNHQKVPLLLERGCKSWQLGQTYLYFLQSPIGFYQSNLGTRCQILLNSHSGTDSRQNFDIVTLSDVLSGEVSKERVEGKIVLIGTTDPRYDDVLWALPSQSNEKIAGLFVQAEMVSHLVDLGLAKRSLLRFWALWQDILWIAAWAILGGAIALWWRSRIALSIAGGLAVVCLAITGQLFLQTGILVAVVPGGLAGVFSGGASRFVRHKLAQQAPSK